MTTLYRQAWGISMCTLILSVQWVTAQNLRISEVFFHSPDVSDIGVEYFEISGPAGMTLTDHTYFIVIRGDADPGGNQGTMFLRFDLGGRTIGPNGYLVVAHNGFFLDVDPDATSLIGNGVTWGNLAIPDFGFRNTSHSFLLITSTDRVFGGDYDADNDGNLDGDATNWTILDGVGYLDGDASDVGYGLINFAYENLGTSVNTKVPVFGLLPGYFARIGSSTGSSASDWIASHINGAAAADFTLTPGSTLPGSFGGTPLNHVGSANPSVGRPSGPFDLQNGLALTQIITNNDDNSVFGRQIDVDAGTAVVSCEFCGPRAAFVYEYNGSQWVRVARLTPSSTASGGSFARSVAIDGDVIVVSNGRNRVYVYEKPPGGWADATETAILSSNDALSGSYNLGETIDIDDNTIIAYEAIFERIVVFEKTGANWVPANETATITGTNTYSYSEFGRGAEIRGDVILAALDGDISAINAALPGFVFTRPPAGWVDTDIDQAAAMLRDTTSMFMGVPYDTYLTDNYAYLMFENNNMNSHRVHIYEKPTGGWGSQNASAQDVQEPIAFLSPSSSATNRFGFSIAGDGDDVLYVGDDQFNSNQGRVEAYLRPCSGRWQSAGPSFVFQAPDNTDDDRFGVSVAVNDDGQLLVGAEQLTAGGKNDVGGFYALDRLPANTFDVGPSDITLLSVNNDAGALVQTYLLDTATVRSAQPSLSTNGSPKIIEASDQQIYGVSRTGDGFVWRSFADGRNFEVIHQFTGTGAGGNGHDPIDLIELFDGRLCGITVGDAAGMGVSAGSLFIIDKDGSNFSNIWTFDASTFLISPTEVFQASNGKIYVSFALGQLYRIDPDGTNLTDLLTTRALDSQALVEVKGKLYGRSRFAGANGRGIIYELDLATDAWSTLYDLTTADGHGIGGGLIAKGDLLYGTNNEGGANGRGTAFLYDLNSSQYTVLHDFPSVPSPTLRQDLTMASDGNIYGLTDRLSSSIFRIHTGFCRLDSVFTYAGDGSVASNFLEIINTPPVLLGAIADTTVLEDAANVALDLSTVFAASDEPANYLEPTAISSDTTLFDSLSIDLGILTVDLAENASGQATITLRATDSRGAFVETSFMVTVEPVIDGQPSVATGFTMTYGDIMEASEALGIGPNAVDSAQMTFLKVSDYANVRLFQMDGTTEVVENSFLPTSIDSIRVLPLQTGVVSFKLQASTSSDDLGLGGTQVTVNGMVNQRSLTVTANDTTAAYGAVLPTFEGTVVGLANADYYSDNITVSYTTTATGDSIATFPILPIVNDPDTRLPNYNLVTNDGTFTVGAASLVVQPNNLTIAYGDTLPLLTGTISGVVNGDNITATYATSADPDSLGTYEITATLQDPDGRLANYQVTNQSGQLEVGPANLRVLLQDASRVYGQSNPTFTFEYQGFVNGEDETVIAEAPTPTSMATPQSDAGTYAITATGGVAPNYNFFFEQATLTVTKASLMVVADDQIRGFGAPNPSLTLSYVGFINGDDTNELDSLPIASTVADAQSDVGTYAISVSGGTDNNYDFAFESGTLTVTQAQATITLTELEQQADGTSRQPKVTTDPPDLNVVLTYDGDTLPPSMTGTYQVIATVDEINYAGVDTATFVLLEEQILSLSAATRTEVYPNPVSDELIVMATGGFRTQLLNLQGVLVRDQRMASNAITMNVRNLPRGVYIVRVLASGDDLLWQGIVRLE